MSNGAKVAGAGGAGAPAGAPATFLVSRSRSLEKIT